MRIASSRQLTNGEVNGCSKSILSPSFLATFDLRLSSFTIVTD